MVTVQDYKAEKATWCPGCGDFSVLAAMQRAAVKMGLHPDDVVIVSGIGCSGKLSQHFGSYGLHSLHGRSLPAAQAVKLANKNLTVFAAGGDGDGFGIGMGHFIHAMRRNIDITYVVMDNHIYGLTTGQTSPTTDVGSRTKTSPNGAIDAPVAPLQLALSANCGFVAQAFSGDVKGLTQIMEKAVNHKGFSFVNVFSPCVTFNLVNTYDFYRTGLVNLDEDGSYNRHDRIQALARVASHDNLVVGVVYEDTERHSYDELVKGYPDTPMAHEPLGLNESQYEAILSTFR